MDMAISNINAVTPMVSPMPGAASGNSPAQASQERRSVSATAADQLLQQIQSHMESMNIGLSFSRYGNKGEEISVIVTDKDTGKVIREIPPKDIQDLHTKLGELIGLIFNHSV
jgi:flagellar protein FlaG